MNLKNKKVLVEIEKRLDVLNKSISHNMGVEIENLDYSFLKPLQKKYFLTLKALAKKHNPEIWESTAITLKHSAYKNNEDFFEFCFLLNQVNLLFELYPDNKKEIIYLYNNSNTASNIDCMYWHALNFIKNNNAVMNWNNLLEQCNIKKVSRKTALA